MAIITIYIVLVALLTTIFFLRMAADMLTPPAIRSYVYAKLILMILLIVGCVPLFAGSWFSIHPPNQNDRLFIFFMALIMLYFFALFWGGQINTHTQHRNDLLHFLLGEGYTPTLIYVIALTISISFSAGISLSDKKALWFGLYCVSYYTFFSGLARLLRRRFLKPDKRTVLIYIILLLALISFNGIIGLIFDSLSKYNVIISNMTELEAGALLAFLPLFFIHSWELSHDVVGFWMLLPFTIGLFAAWLGKEETTEECKVNLHKHRAN